MKDFVTKNIREFLMLILFFGLMMLGSQAFSQYQVGHTQITFQDAARGNRDIQTEIYYPASTSGDDVSMVADTFPVIVFGHGFVMAWSAYENLWAEFVPRGYIMVFPRTEGSITGTDHQQFGWDLQFLVTEMQNENMNTGSIFYQGVAQNTALMGHSMGGGAAFLAADSLCTNGNVNLKTLVGLAPAESSTNGVSSINSALSVTIPSVVLSGSSDGVTPPIDHHIPMYDNLAGCKTFIDVLGGAHCYFANTNTNCDFGEGTASTGISITREEQHAITFDFVNLWLDYTLKGDCHAFSEFNDSLQNSVRVDYNQVCTLNPIPVISENNGDLTSSETGVSYQWYLNGSPISNSNSPTITPTQDGNYTVEVIFANGCPEISAPYLVTLTSIQNYLIRDFNVYPNPATHQITIVGDQVDLHQLSIYNYAGKQMFDYQVIGNAIDVSQFNKGIYFIRIGDYIKKLIIQ